MQTIQILGTELQLLPQKAIYVPSLKSLLVSDVHLGKSETFQALGVPISNQVNQATLDRLQVLCDRHQPDHLFILGDLFHSKQALVEEVLEQWFNFLAVVQIDVKLIVGNHDRALVPTLQQLSLTCLTDPIQIDALVLSHEPIPQSAANQPALNICGHVHPCVRLKTRLDTLRLPCFYLNNAEKSLILPSFGEFTGGYEVPLVRHTIAYAIAEDQVISFAG